MYETPFSSVEDIIARISVAARRIRNMSEIFQNVKNSIQRLCQTTYGHNFEHPSLEASNVTMKELKMFPQITEETEENLLNLEDEPKSPYSTTPPLNTSSSSSDSPTDAPSSPNDDIQLIVDMNNRRMDRKNINVKKARFILLLFHNYTTLGLLATDHVILNHGEVTWTTPELAPPLLTTTPTGGRFSSRQI
ncbi:hypothetical protein TNCV_1135021 [Trichonephila clavipes]|nr:hypothetical protein TNCV_1135021 [Trichonephila clavipes]